MAHRSAPKTVSVPEVIQQIINSTKDVREYKEECEAISQRLISLKKKLYDSNNQQRHGLETAQFEKVVKSLLRTLPKVKNVINQCQNPTTLKGAQKLTAVRALERELDNIKYSLTGYEADLTNDLQEKRNILSSTLSEKQRIDRHRRDAHNVERARLMLELIAAEATTVAQENLAELSKKYNQIINNYLTACDCVLTGIPVVGLEAGIKNFITNVYQLPPSESSPQRRSEIRGTQPSLEPSPQDHSEIRDIQLPLESVYIHLKADHSTTFEREQARKLISKDDEQEENVTNEDDRELWEKLGSAPTIEFLNERGHVHKKKDIEEKSNFREILQNNRWIVMLGDPGSGKTTFVRWLVSRYIDALTRGEQTVSSDYENQRQEKKKNDKKESYVIGPVRMPILIRVGEFVDALDKKTDLTLFNYIGHHTWMGNPMFNMKNELDKKERESLSKQLQEALQQYVAQGYALIVLDGLDEISDLDTRTRVVRLVEDFVGIYVPTPENVSVLDDQFIDRELDIPSKIGGNQLIITSRIVGYQARPLSGQFSHYTILPMTLEDMKNFVDHWFVTVHRKMIDALKLDVGQDTMEKGCTGQTIVLQEEIEKPGNDGLRRLASNPCLLNFICLISFQEHDAKLPSERICLYDKLAKSMLKLWSIKDPHGLMADSNKVERLLCDIATYIHENSSSGLIETSNLKMVCLKSLKPFTDTKSDAAREKDAQYCIDKFKNNAGILIARGQQLYSFLHLTLQEYYTCKNMVTILKEKGRAQKLVEVFQRRITDPRFRVPLTLALGWVSWKWDQVELDEFCEKLFASQSDMSQYFPLETLMFVTSIRELKKLPSKKQIFIAFTGLLFVSARNNWHINYPDLEKRMAIGLLKLSGILIEEWVGNMLSSKESTVESITALCTLLQECKRLAKSEGNEENRELLKEWTNREVCKVLSKCLSNDTINNQFIFDTTLAQAAITNPIALPSNNLQKFFLENPDSLTKLSLSMLAAVIALYGGLILSGNKEKRKKNARYAKDGDIVTSVDFAVTFSPQCMHRKSPLTTFIIECIRAELADNGVRSKTVLFDRIRQKAEQISSDDQSLEAVDTFILMFCIVGVDTVWLYKPFVQHEAFHQAINRFKRICNYLRQFYFIPEIYDRYRNSISSKDSLISNYDSFNENIYNKYTINRDSTELIDLFMIWQRLVDKTHKKPSSKSLEGLFVFVDSICRGRSRLCTSGRTRLTNKWICKTDQRLLLLPKVFQKEENLQQLLGCPSTQPSLSDLSFPMFLRTLWTFDDYRHGADMSEVTIENAECSMILAYDRNHCFALAFVEKHLQLLFSRAINGGHIVLNSRTKNQTTVVKSAYALSFGHVLCSSLLSICKFPITFACQSALITLLPLSRIYRLESLILALLCWTKNTSELDPGAVKWYFEEMQRPTDPEHFSYTDGYKTLTKVNRTEISDEEEANGIIEAINKEVQRLQEALELLKSNKSEEKGNVEVFSASVCLGYLGWSSTSGEGPKLFKKAIKAASKITNPLMRLDALNILASCPIIRSSEQILQDLSDVRVMLNELLEEAFSELPSDLTPLLSVSLWSQYISLVGANAKSINKINHILDQTKDFKDEDDRRAVCITLGPYVSLSPDLSSRLFQLMQGFRTLPVSARAQVLQFDSPVLRYFVESSEHTANTPPFLHNHAHSQSISVLYSCLYLVNLSSDVQKLTVWLNDSQPTKVDISHSLNWQVDRSQQKRMLTYSHIFAIEKKFESLGNSRSITNELMSLEKELFDFQKCEPNAGPLLMKWLKYAADSPYYPLACHAALISARSDIWTKDNANIICDLLESDNDRFRQEAECLLHGKNRNSSELGWDVLHTFIKRFISYETQSTHAALVLTWLFTKLTIDNPKYLDKIFELENQRIDIKTEHKKKSEDRSIPTEQLNSLQYSSPIARWFIHLTPSLMKQFARDFQSFIEYLTDDQNDDHLKKKYQRQFIFGWCARILEVDTNDIGELLEILSNMLNGNFSTELQCSAAFAIGHSRTSEAQKILLDSIKNESKGKVTRSIKVMTMCVHAYCWSCCSDKNKSKNNSEEEHDDDDDDNKKNDKKTDETDNIIQSLCVEMLKHDSRKVHMAASIELAKVCHDVKELLKTFDYDTEHCYKSLTKIRINQSFIDPWKKHSKCLVDLIKAHPDLLRIFIIDLYESIADFDVYIEPYPDWSENFGDTFLVPVACDLVEEMPAAFFNEVKLSSDTENLKKALLNTIKQHNYVRRNACLKLISTFGDFTTDICKIFINAVIENPSTQAASYDSIKRFRKPLALTKLEMAVQQLDRVLEQLETNVKPSKSSSASLTSVLQELKQIAQMDIRSARSCIKQGLEQLEIKLNKLKGDKKQLTLDLEALKQTLIELEPILEQWEPALKRLNRYLKSDSLNKRWIAALFLERLVQCNLVSAYRVQELLNKTIEDSTSNAELWLPKTDDAQSFYECAGSLSQMLCRLLMRMSLVDETSSEIKVIQVKNRLLEDFDIAETSAQLASCITVDEDLSDIENNSDDID